ncbi:hypothetical protein GCM10027421_28570 [Microbacterium shaanxiense]
MNAMRPLLLLRTDEVMRTWRVWVLPAVLVFLAATGPIITRFTKEILAGALGGGEAGAILLPDPTAADAAGRWITDLSQLAVFVVVVMAAGAINGEVRSGVASLMLVKPASRTAYVVSHAIVLILFVAVSALIGVVASWAVTRLVWGDGEMGTGVDRLGTMLGATGMWIVLAAVLITASLLASAAFDALAAAAGIGIGAYFLLLLAGTMPRLAEYTPAGLIPTASAIATGVPVNDAALWWPVITGVIMAVVLLASAVLVFRRKELR